MTADADDVLDALRELTNDADPVHDAPEVADVVDGTRRTVLGRLDVLEARGDVASKPVGRGRVWWPVPLAEFLAEPSAAPSAVPPAENRGGEESPPAEPSAEPPEEPSAGPGGDGLRERAKDALDDVDVPARGRDQERARKNAVLWAWDFLRENAPTGTRDIANAVFYEFEDDPDFGYSAASSRYDGYSAWDSCIRDALAQLPGVHSPGQGGTVWKFDPE
ncbi:hypothetical protein [Halocalculus aciditolerans]|uniref:Uncharacterized protein n=1 Tax=Halocalculus aciditolerans TaxID=1383812 RepID=A0A830F8E2_9EURY|nr:hypothetical protein [Halocalculus aciditolerans]GGL73478.1 hypothetical protein GCM10009039_34490 [Halocalculus aciditolerans]